MSPRRRHRTAASAAIAALVILAGCADPSTTGPTSRYSGFPDGPAGEFAPVGIGGVAACSSLTLAAHPAGGKTEISLPCLTGPRVVNVDALGGRPTVVNLWASWCSVCRKEMPVLEAAHRASGDAMQFVGVDVMDETGPAADFLRQTGVTYPQLYDQQGDLLKYTRITGLPVTLLLDAGGREVGRHVGELTEDALRDLLDKA